MICPKCGYVMDAFELDCPRCKRIAAKSPEDASPAPLPTLEKAIIQTTDAETPPVEAVEMPNVQSAVNPQMWIILGVVVFLCITLVTGLLLTHTTSDNKKDEHTAGHPATTPVTTFTDVPPATPPTPAAPTPLTTQNTTTSMTKRPQEIVQLASPSVVMIGVGNAAGDRALGSGFVVANGIVATNSHVVKNADVAVVKLIGQKAFFDVDRVLTNDVDADLALLSVPTLHAPALQLGRDEDVHIGDKIYVLGSPEGWEGTFSDGMVSGIRKSDNGTIGAFQISAPISHGSSGGPVLNERGQVIGVASLSDTAGQNLNFAMPVSGVSRLLSSAPTSVGQQPAATAP